MIFKLLKSSIYVKMSGFFRDKKENDKLMYSTIMFNKFIKIYIFEKLEHS